MLSIISGARTMAAALALGLALNTESCDAITRIGFDDVSPGTTINTQYPGVVFEPMSGNLPRVAAGGDATGGEVPTPPNVAIIPSNRGDLFWGSTLKVKLLVPARRVVLMVGSTAPERAEVTLTAKNASGSVVKEDKGTVGGGTRFVELEVAAGGGVISSFEVVGVGQPLLFVDDIVILTPYHDAPNR